jgi:hypothetical protein
MMGLTMKKIIFSTGLLGLFLSAAPLSHAQESPPDDAVKAAAPSSAPTENSLTARLTASCLAGATVGTFVFPGVGSAAGCVIGSGLALIFRPSAPTDPALKSSPEPTTTPTPS